MEKEKDGMVEDLFVPDLFVVDEENELSEMEFGVGGGEVLRVKLSHAHAANQLLAKFVPKVVWPSAVELAKFFAGHVSLLKGKKVVELGSGTGLCGIVAACLGAEVVVLTDSAESSLELIKENARLNGVEGKCKCESLTWGNVEELQRIGCDFDVVIGTDVVYEPECIAPLLKSANALLKKESGFFFLANHKYRFVLYENEVSKQAKLFGFAENRQPSLVGDEGSVEFVILQQNQETSL